MRVVTLVLSLLAAWPGAVARAEPNSAGAARASLLWVERELRRGHSERAERGLARALKRSPAPALMLRYAELLLPFSPARDGAEEKKRVEAAEILLAALEQSATQQTPLPEALGLYAAWAHAVRGDFSESLSLAERHGQRDQPDTVRCLRAVAALALAHEQRTVAQHALRLARAFGPTEPDLATELGLLLLAQGDAQRALPVLAERFALDPRWLSARRDLAYALSAAGRPREGYELLRAEGDACAIHADCALELTRWALEGGQLAGAVSHAQALLARAPTELAALHLLAEAQLALAERALARQTYARILGLAPGDLRAQSALQALGVQAPAPP